MEHSAQHRPSFQSQLHPVEPSSAFPYRGRDPMDHGCAIFTIVDSMRQLELALQTSTFLRWLGRWEGFEMHVDDRLDPMLCVRQVLLQHVAALQELKDQELPQLCDLWREVVNALLKLEFIHTRTYWGSPLQPRAIWNPLENSWMDFLTMGQEGESLTTWQPSSGQPEFARLCAEALLTGQF